jgi:hypothetical protein
VKSTVADLGEILVIETDPVKLIISSLRQLRKFHIEDIILRGYQTSERLVLANPLLFELGSFLSFEARRGALRVGNDPKGKWKDVKESQSRLLRFGPLRSRKERDCRQEDSHYLEVIFERLRPLARLQWPLFEQFIRTQILADRRELQAYLPCPTEVILQ